MPAFLAGSTIVLTAVVFAAEGDGLPPWAQVAIAVATGLAVMTKRLAPWWVIDDKDAQIAEHKADKRELMDRLLNNQEQMIPALTKTSEAMARYAEEIRYLRGRRE